MKKVNNIYLIIILIILIIILLNFITEGFTNYNSNIETFESPDISDGPISSNEQLIKDVDKIMNKQDTPSPSIEDEDDSSYLDDIENKELVISDFYPTEKLVNKKSKEEILDFTFKTDLFHQIIPIYKKGYIGIVSYDKRINGLYYSKDLEKKEWELIPNSIPEGMLRPIFITYDKDRQLLGIFEEDSEESDYILNKYHLYKKKSLSIGCKWEHIEKTKIISIIYGNDDKLIGIDMKGRFYKKSNRNINSEWNKLELNFEHIPMRKLIIQNGSNIFIGLGTDFRIYRKKFNDWENSEWDTINGPTKKGLLNSVRDIFYDYDNKLCGLSRIGLVKKEDINYLSQFKIYKKNKTKILDNNEIIYSITGIKLLPVFNNTDNNIKDVIIDGKKLSEYKFKDPRLNEFLKFRMNLKKQCNKIKNLKIEDEQQNNLEEEEEIRNQKFQNILNKQKDTIDNLLDTIESLKQKSFSE